MSEMDQSFKLKSVSNFIISILFLIQHNFVVYKTEYVVKIQGADTSTKIKKIEKS